MRVTAVFSAVYATTGNILICLQEFRKKAGT